MAKFEEIFEDIEESFVEFIKLTNGLNDVNIKIIANNSLKEIGNVVKATDLVKYMVDQDVIIILNQNVFEKLDAPAQIMVIEELVARIYFDAEKGQVKIIKPDVVGFSLVIQKYGFDNYMRTQILIKEIFAQEAEIEAEAE